MTDLSSMTLEPRVVGPYSRWPRRDPKPRASRNAARTKVKPA